MECNIKKVDEGLQLTLTATARITKKPCEAGTRILIEVQDNEGEWAVIDSVTVMHPTPEAKP